MKSYCKICSKSVRTIYDDQYDHNYYCCDNCEYIFLDENKIIPPDQEKKEYSFHENSFSNEGYVNMLRDFIDKAIKPYKSQITTALDFGSGPVPSGARAGIGAGPVPSGPAPSGARAGIGAGPVPSGPAPSGARAGIGAGPVPSGPAPSGARAGIGAGPGPVLAELLRKEGFQTDIYDKYFAPEKVYLNKKYDLITATEVFEHLKDPLSTLKLLKKHLNANGILAIMTLFHQNDDEHFKQWWYRRDSTHISFYTPKTLQYMADLLGMKIILVDDKNVCVMREIRT